MRVDTYLQSMTTTQARHTDTHSNATLFSKMSPPRNYIHSIGPHIPEQSKMTTVLMLIFLHAYQHFLSQSLLFSSLVLILLHSYAIVLPHRYGTANSAGAEIVFLILLSSEEMRKPN